MARLWVEPASLTSGTRRVEGDDFRYLARVLRLAHGDELVLFDGAGREASARVEHVDGLTNHLILQVGEPRPVAARADGAARVVLLCALLKGEKMDLVVQKACELGAARLVPVQAARSVVKLDAARGRSRTERWRKIAREAARQCGRADVLEVAEVASLDDALAAAAAEEGARFVFHEGARTSPLAAALPATRVAQVTAAVGPEGGFTADEVEHARVHGFVPVGLGPRVLRAETAALAALAVLGWTLGDLR
jgi:16S rRNA (uracil1498-N3)-methyltransferase